MIDILFSIQNLLQMFKEYVMRIFFEIRNYRRYLVRLLKWMREFNVKKIFENYFRNKYVAFTSSSSLWSMILNYSISKYSRFVSEFEELLINDFVLQVNVLRSFLYRFSFCFLFKILQKVIYMSNISRERKNKLKEEYENTLENEITPTNAPIINTELNVKNTLIDIESGHNNRVSWKRNLKITENILNFSRTFAISPYISNHFSVPMCEFKHTLYYLNDMINNHTLLDLPCGVFKIDINERERNVNEEMSEILNVSNRYWWAMVFTCLKENKKDEKLNEFIIRKAFFNHYNRQSVYTFSAHTLRRVTETQISKLNFESLLAQTALNLNTFFNQNDCHLRISEKFNVQSFSEYMRKEERRLSKWSVFIFKFLTSIDHIDHLECVQVNNHYPLKHWMFLAVIDHFFISSSSSYLPSVLDKVNKKTISKLRALSTVCAVSIHLLCEYNREFSELNLLRQLNIIFYGGSREYYLDKLADVYLTPIEVK